MIAERKGVINAKVARMSAAMSPTKTYVTYRRSGDLVYKVSASVIRTPEGRVSYGYSIERVLSKAEREAKRADVIRNGPAWDHEDDDGEASA